MVMDKRALISVIVPIYSAEKYLDQCLKSILNQTHRNLEIILINDGSPDSCGEICEEYSKRDKRIKVIHKENGGVSSARNIGLKASTGEYISFVDPDDYISTSMIEILYKEALQSKSDIVSCCAMIITEKGLVKNSFFKGKNYKSTLINKETAIIQLISNQKSSDADNFIDIGVPWGKIYKSEMIFSNDLKFKENLRRMQDNIFNLYAFQYSSRIVYIDQPLYFYNTTNIKKEFNKYVGDADYLFKNLIFETKTFLEKYDWYLEGNFKKAYALKVTLFLLSILNSKIFHEENKITVAAKLSEAKSLVLLEPFNTSLKEVDISFFKIHNKILIKLLNNKRFYMAYNVVLLKNSIKNRRFKTSYSLSLKDPKI